MTHRNARGFTLVEVLFAITLFALVGLSVNVLAIGSSTRTLENRHGGAAVFLAQREAEELRSLPYDDVRSRSSTATEFGAQYTITTLVQDDNPAPDMKHITITVDWTIHGGSHDYEIQTIYTPVSS